MIKSCKNNCLLISHFHSSLSLSSHCERLFLLLVHVQSVFFVKCTQFSLKFSCKSYWRPPEPVLVWAWMCVRMCVPYTPKPGQRHSCSTLRVQKVSESTSDDRSMFTNMSFISLLMRSIKRRSCSIYSKRLFSLFRCAFRCPESADRMRETLPIPPKWLRSPFKACVQGRSK